MPASWAHVQDNPGSPAVIVGLVNAGSGLSLGSFASANTVGNQLFVMIAGNNNSGVFLSSSISVTDDAVPSNTYSNLFFKADSNNSWCALFGTTIQTLPGSGKLSPKMNVLAQVSTFLTGCASEFSGGSLTPDTPAVTGSASAASSITLTLTTNQRNSLAIGVMACLATISVLTIPSGFTDIGQLLSNASSEPGEASYDIISGMVLNKSVQWSTGASTTLVAGVVALQVNPSLQGPGLFVF